MGCSVPFSNRETGTSETDQASGLTTSTRSSKPVKSAGFRVYSLAPSTLAVAAITRSNTRGRGLRPATTTAWAHSAYERATRPATGIGSNSCSTSLRRRTRAAKPGVPAARRTPKCISARLTTEIAHSSSSGGCQDEISTLVSRIALKAADPMDPEARPPGHRIGRNAPPPSLDPWAHRTGSRPPAHYANGSGQPEPAGLPAYRR